MNIVIVGTGYVGLTCGLGFAKLGHKVACVDIDAEKINQLDLGNPTFFEPGTQELLNDLQETGRIVFTTELASVIGEADVILIAVGTPPGPHGEADASAVFAVADDIGTHLDHPACIVVKSTVPVGTSKRVHRLVQKRLHAAGRGSIAEEVKVAFVPEFLREGSALEDFFTPDRLVFGTETNSVLETMEEMHAGIEAPRVHMSIASAELTKYASNAMLATKISFINEISNIAARVGANIKDIAKAVGMDHRISNHFLGAGIGYGGSCFPKDISGLQQLAGAKRYEGKLLSAVIEVNNRQRELFFKRIQHQLRTLHRRRIAVWGLAYKGGTDDVRESPAIDIVRLAYSHGADIVAYDPKAMKNAKRVLPNGISYAPTAIDAANGAEVLLVLTDWGEFRDVSFQTLHMNMLDPVIFDGRNLLSDLNLDQYGFKYHGIAC